MFGKIAELLSDLRPSKLFFRVLAVVLLIIVTVSWFPWTESIFKPVLGFPEIRHEVTVGSNGSKNDSVKLTVFNSGFAPAEDVLVHINVQDGSITDYQVHSQELYEVKTADLGNGVFDIWLDRLTSGAEVSIEITGTGFVTDSVSLSAASKQGINIASDSPGLRGRIDLYTVKLKKAGESIWTASRVREVRNWLANRAVFKKASEIVMSERFRTIGLAALIVILAMAVLAPETLLLLPFVAGFLLWLFADLPIRVWWIVAFCALLLIYCFAQITDEEPRIGILLLLITLVLAGFLIWWLWYVTIPGVCCASLIVACAPFILIGIGSLNGSSSSSPDTRETSRPDSGTVAQYEQRIAELKQHIAELKRELERKDYEYRLLAERIFKYFQDSERE